MSMFSMRNSETALLVFRIHLKNPRTAGAGCLTTVIASGNNSRAIQPTVAAIINGEAVTATTIPIGKAIMSTIESPANPTGTATTAVVTASVASDPATKIKPTLAISPKVTATMPASSSDGSV